MEAAMWFCVTLAVACAGGWLGKKLKLPAGLLVGSMIAVAAFHLATRRGVFFAPVRVGLQVFSGALVGCRMGKNELKSMKSLVWSVIVLLAAMLLLNVTFAFLVMLVSDLSPATALFATSPGGATDMSIIAPDFGGDPSLVAILQVSRLMMIYLFLPPVIRWVDRRAARKHPQTPGPQGAAQPLAEASREGTDKKQFLLLLAAAAVGGTLLHLSGLSAGAMIGAMVGSAVYCVARGRQKYPVFLKNLLQLVSGAYIGCRIDRATVARFPDLILPLAIMLAGIFVFTFATSAVLRRLSRLDRSTAMLASSPGGIQEMSLLSEELGADTPKVAVLHTARVVFVILLFPYMIRLLLTLLP